MNTDRNPPDRHVILAVDDREGNLQSMRVLLRDLDADIVTVTSGQAAIEVALSEPRIAVILLDVDMPGLDGFETAEILRINESTRRIPILFVTADCTQVSHVFRGYECGAVDFLPKPIDSRVIDVKVRVFLELARERAARAEAVRCLKLSNEALALSNQGLQDFAYAAAHDLKTPVRHMQFWINSLIDQNGSELSPDVASKMAEIRGAASRLDTLIGTLLQFAVVDATPVPMESVRLNDVIADVLHDFTDVIAAAGGNVDVEELPTVRGSRDLLYQLFQNLLSNAIKYRRPDAPLCVQIRSDTDDTRRQCCISVVDNGKGFDPSMSEQIFEPFKRLASAAGVAGTGIGMASAQKIVALHKGAIRAESEDAFGATFVVTLPCERQGAITSLLLVDDSSVDLELTRHVVRGTGYRILEADGAEAALKVLAEDQVDAVLSDYRMPCVDGISLLSQIADRYPSVRRFLVSASSPQELAAAKRSGVVEAFFPKTVNLEELLDVMRNPVEAC